MFLVVWLAATLAWAFPSPAVTLVDDTGAVLNLSDSGRVRVVALYGAVSELLCAMELGDQLVGRTDADAEIAGLPDFANLAALPSVGTHLRPDPERIVALRPDLIIQILGRRDTMESIQRLRRLGLPVAAFTLNSVDDMLRLADRLGTALGASDKAARLCGVLTARLDAVAERVQTRVGNAPRPRVIFEVRWPNLLVAGEHSLVDDVIRRAGGINAITASGRTVRLNEEALLGLDPDVYVYQRGPMNPDPMPPGQRPHGAALRAIRTDRILEVDEAVFSRPGPRAVEAVEILAGFLWP